MNARSEGDETPLWLGALEEPEGIAAHYVEGAGRVRTATASGSSAAVAHS